MAQRIQQMGNVPYAQEAMMFSSLKQGLGAMSPPNQGMSQQQDGGLASKPGANSQMQRSADLAMQNVQQNAISAAPQAQVAMRGQGIKQSTEINTAETAEKQYMNRKLADTMDMMELGEGMNRLNYEMGDPVRAAQFENNIAVSRAQGNSPELSQLMVEANRYG